MRKNGPSKVERYWDLLDRSEEVKISEEKAIKEFRKLFEKSINERVRSNVPIGAELSGGLDSSGIVSMASSLLRERNLSINTYRRRQIYKETHFFSSKLYHRYGLNYYKSFFPTKLHKFICKFIYNRKVSSFEASTSYFDNELTPKRVFSIIPHVKIILLLRNPIDRAFSHYNMLKRFNQIRISFERALKQEKREFLGIGTYIHPIKRWNEYFDLNDIFIIKSEEFFENPSKILSALYKFLKIPNYTPKRFRVYRSANKEDSGNKKPMDYDKLNEETRKELYNYFFPYNQLLYKYLGRDFQWNE